MHRSEEVRIKYKGKLYYLISYHHIESVIRDLTRRISKEYPEANTLLTLVRGGLIPTRKFSDYLGIRDVYVMGVSNYDGTKKLEKPVILQEPPSKVVRNKHVVVVDDVGDTGESYRKVVNEFVIPANPKSYRTAVLYKKPWCNFEYDFVGKTLPGWHVYFWEKVEFAEEKIREEIRKGKKLKDAMEDISRIFSFNNFTMECAVRNLERST